MSDSEQAEGCVVCAAGASADKEASGRDLTRGASLRRGVAGAVGSAGVFAGSAFATRAPTGGKPSGRGAPARGKRPIVIEPSWVLAYDETKGLTLLRDHSVVVEGDRIAAIVEGRWRGKERRVRAHGKLLLPGFISGHTHVAGGTATRGIIEGGRSFARPLVVADKLDNDDLDDLTAFNLAELLRGGCTTQLEMALSLKQAESYVRVARNWCVRGYPGGMVPGIGTLFPVWFRADDQTLFDSVPATLAEIAANLEFARSVNGAEEGRILPQMTPHATDTQTPETMRAFAAAAKELGNGIHLHLSQSTDETNTVKRLWGKRPVEWLDDFGFYDGPLFAAHLSGADLENDPRILKEKGAVYAHNPSAGGAGGGTQPWPEFLAAGVLTNIGIDTHSNDQLENIKLAVLYAQARHSLIADASPVPMARPTIWDAIRAATINAAKGLGRDDLGRISVGAKADLVTIDVTGFLAGVGAPPPEPLNNLLYAHGLSVCDVMTDGHFQVWNGHLVIDDERRVIKRGGRAAQLIWDQLAGEDWFTPTPA
jgi:5-methylthioadenosine/S-adenosylhomocysteine deaminase